MEKYYSSCSGANKSGGGAAAEDWEVVIVGAGIAGLATALALRRIGAEGVVVLERAPCLRTTGAALTLFPNAWRALDALGVAHELIPLYSAFQSGKITNISTGVTQEVPLPSSAGMGVRTVHRKTLLESLSEELPPGTVRFSTKITSISTQSPEDPSSGVVLHLDDGTVIRAKLEQGRPCVASPRKETLFEARGCYELVVDDEDVDRRGGGANEGEDDYCLHHEEYRNVLTHTSFADHTFVDLFCCRYINVLSHKGMPAGAAAGIGAVAYGGGRGWSERWRGNPGWYLHQDMAALNGTVVRLWENEKRLAASRLVRRRQWEEVAW